MNLRFVLFCLILNLGIFNIISKSMYINRWEFQSICDYVFDPHVKVDKSQWGTSSKGVTFNPKDVKPRSIIFVRRVDQFFRTIAKYITVPYIIVTHGHYADAFKPEYVKYLEDPKIIAWFGIHSETTHPKFHQIPIGVFQDYQVRRNKHNILKLFENLRNKYKKKLIYINFEASKNRPERIVLQNKFKNKPYCTYSPSNKPFEQYLQEMGDCKFTMSPVGLAIDCYRTWEALLVGSIPVVKSSGLNPLYKDLPILVIDDWNKITAAFLNNKYIEIISKKYNLEKLFMNYWKKKILAVKHQK